MPFDDGWGLVGREKERGLLHIVGTCKGYQTCKICPQTCPLIEIVLNMVSLLNCFSLGAGDSVFRVVCKHLMAPGVAYIHLVTIFWHIFV